MKPEDIQNIEPTVNLKLSEYNRIMKYIDFLDNAIGISKNPFQNALTDVIEFILRNTSGSNSNLYPNSITMSDVRAILINHNLIVGQGGERGFTISQK